MIDFDRIEDLEAEPGPRCPFCHEADMDIDEHFPDTVVFRCPSCFMRALPRQLQNPPSNGWDATLFLGVFVIISVFVAIIVLGIAVF
jgi:hypothetical protein